MYGFNIFSGDDWLHLFNTILLAPMQGICYIIFFAEQLFYTLACGFTDKSGNITLNFVDVIMTGSTVQKIILGSFVLAIFLVLLFAIIAVIKQYTNYKEEPNSRAVAGDSIKSFAVMLCIPLIAFVSVYLITTLTAKMYWYLGGGSMSDPVNSIANHLFITLGKWKNLPDTFWFGEMGAWDIVGKYYPSMDLGNYQYIIGYVTGFILFFNLGKAALQAGKRIFDIALLYVVSPLSSSTYPIDQGKRWGVWINLFVSKLLSALVMIYSFFIYLAFMEVLKTELHIQGSFIDFSDPGGEITIKNLCYIILLITGAMATSGAPTLIGHLISEQAGSLAAADASAIDSDLKWGTMMGGKMLGAACGVAKDIWQGSGGGAGGGARGGAGALASGNRLLNAVGSFRKGGVVGLAGNALQKGRANSLNRQRQIMQNKFGSTNAQDMADFAKANAKYKRMTGQAFTADDMLKNKQAASQTKKAAKAYGVDMDYLKNNFKRGGTKAKK